MTLYHGEPNGPSLTVLATLFEKGLSAELVHVDLAGGARRQLPVSQQTEVAMSVEGEGPVLVVDGEGMTESVFIACYLDDVGSGPALRPVDPYARWELMAWCRQLTERAAPAAAFLGCQAFPPKMPTTVTPTEELRRDCESKITQAVAKIEARLADRSWLMGEFSIADLESYAWLAGMVELLPAAFADQPRSAAWLARVRQRPAVARALALARVPDPLRWWAPGPEINRWG
jgi:GSH-dependent disulfide-bond oxidoreductase